MTVPEGFLASSFLLGLVNAVSQQEPGERDSVSLDLS